jgi:hypothetical protein
MGVFRCGEVGMGFEVRAYKDLGEQYATGESFFPIDMSVLNNMWLV